MSRKRGLDNSGIEGRRTVREEAAELLGVNEVAMMIW